MANSLDLWYRFALQQVAAESILDRIPAVGLQRVLFEGNTDVRRSPNGEPSGHTRVPAALAANIIGQYQIVAHHANDSTGFSGTLLRWTNDQGGTEYTLSLRSTEFKPFNKGGDRERDNLSGANGEIIGSGFAIGQLAALEDFYRREVLPIVGANKLNVTGYSLGGHLATVFTEMHADRVKAAYVFNGAGRGRFLQGETTAERMTGMVALFSATLVSEPNADVLNGLSTEARKAFLPLYQSALRAYLADPAWNPFAPTDSSVYADPRYRWAKAVTSVIGPYVTGPGTPFRAGLGTPGDALITSIYGSAMKNDSTLVSNSQIHASNKRAIYIEGQPFIEGVPTDEKNDFGNTHAITLIVDSLALMREFQRLDPSLSQSQIELLIGASSARKAKVSALLSDENAAEGDSLEKTLFALRKAFDLDARIVQFDAKPGGFSDIGNRQSYFENLARLPQEGTYRIEVLAGKSASQIALLAQRTDDTGLAVRYALRELEPFAVVGGNYGSSRFPNGELGLYSASTGRGVTPKWIEARSRLLETLLRHNAADGDLSAAQIGDYVQDQSRLIALGSSQPERARIIFASDSNEQALIGFNRDDLIFGGANGEPITVNAGNDYVEGGGGIDVISGGPGRDELHGGPGNDQLDGGTEADKLYGGAGFDTYVYAAGDGQDQIIDSDDSGQIRYKGRILTGGSRTGKFEFVDGEGVRYELVGDATARTLVIDGKLTVRNFSSGQLGIVLEGEPSGPVRPDAEATRTYVQQPPDFGWLPYPTDRPPDDGYSGEAHLRYNFVNIFGSDANDTFTYVDHPFGLPGFYGRGGDDELTIAGAVGSATLNAGAGNDVIDASASTLMADRTPAILVGGGGDDYIVGGSADETIWGDNYRVQERFQYVPGFAGSTASSSSSYLIDDFIVNLRDAYPNILQDVDTETLDVLANAGAYYYEEGPFHELGGTRLPAYIIQYEGTEGLLQYLQLEGWLNLGDPSAAVDYVVGVNATFDDFIDGGAGNDTIYAGSGADDVRGGTGNDRIDGDRNVSADALGTLALRFGMPGDDVLDGGEGDDALSDLLGGSDTLIGGAGDDALNSDERTWSLEPAKAAFNYFDGGDGDDRITSTNLTPDGYDIADGGSGNDVISISSSGGGTILGGDGNDFIAASGSTGAFDVDGGPGNDTYHVSNGTILDESGDDSLSVAPPLFGESVDETFDAVARGLLPLPEGLTLDEKVIRRGNDLVVFFALTFADQNQASSLTIVDWFASEARPIEHILTTGGEISPLQLESWGSLAFGSGADEVFEGGEYRDRIVAGGGIDLVSSGNGDDLIAGGSGDDVLDGGDGDDTYYYALGDGDDVIIDEGGDDRLAFVQGIGAGDVAIHSRRPSSVLLSVAGATIELKGSSTGEGLAIERLLFSDGQEVAVSGLLETTIAVDGAEGNDFVEGSAAANILSGGPGDDVLSGNEGEDTYLFNVGDGVDRIFDPASPGEGNAIRFGPGISPDTLSLGLGSLQIRVGQGGDAIHLDSVDANDVLGVHDVDLFEFDDGTRLTYAELLARGLDLQGTPFDDIITGSSIADRVRGYGGDDVLVESAGDDTYLFNRGDGADTLVGQAGAAGGVDRLVLGTGIAVQDVSVRRSGDDIVLELNADGGSVTVQQALLLDVVEDVQFADGSVWTAAKLREQAGSAPSGPPITSGGTAPISNRETTAFATDSDALSGWRSSLERSPDRRENFVEGAYQPSGAESQPQQVGVPLDPLARDMQQRFDVLLQTGRTNLGERYAEAVREFEQRRLQREDPPPPPPPTDEEVAAWNAAMHAWHDRNPGFAESELGGSDGTWSVGWGLPGPGERAYGGAASVGALPGLANSLSQARLGGVASAPMLGEGLRDVR